MRVATLPSGTRVIVPPSLFQAVTAKLTVASDPATLREAQKELEQALTELDARYETTPGGLGLTVGWGWAYFRRYAPRLADTHLPLDVALSRRLRRPIFSLLDAIRFPSDPRTTVLESNDVAFVFRSNVASHISEATDRIFHDLGDLFELTSIRHGFVGAGSPRRHANDSHLPGAAKISRSAPLFFGAYPLHPFGEGPGRITNVETLGYASRVDYFRAGTHMHLSHLSEDITSFYRADPAQRVDWLLGHGFAISRRTGLSRTTVGHDGRSYAANAGLIQRSYANTTENPFSWSSDRARDHWRAEPAAGLHFVAFSATSNIFHQYRFAMDARDDRGRPLPANVGHDRDVASHGFNRLVQATHRQNFLVPPRVRRSFPLVELL